MSENIWWGEHCFELGESLLWEIGGVRIVAQRQQMEWVLASADRESGERAEWSLSHLTELPAGFDDKWERYVHDQSDKPLHIVPTLADRPVVSRPSSPFTLLPGELARIYVSTPLWARFETHDGKQALKEFPLLRLSDTWFGTSTREGELCYAARTRARLSLENMPFQPHRVISSIVLKNTADQPLLLERINLPVTYLGLYQSEEGYLWTEEIELIREEEKDLAQLKIKPGPPDGVKVVKKIAQPRDDSRNGLLVRAFSSLFG